MRTLFVRQAALDGGHHIGRQVRHQIGNFVGIHIAGGGDQVRSVHGANQRFTCPVRYFQQYICIVLGIHQLPDGLALQLGQGLQNEGNVSWVQIVQDGLDLALMLAMDQTLKQVGAVVVFELALGQRLHHFLALEDAFQAIQCLLRILGLQTARLGSVTGRSRGYQVFLHRPACHEYLERGQRAAAALVIGGHIGKRGFRYLDRFQLQAFALCIHLD